MYNDTYQMMDSVDYHPYRFAFPQASWSLICSINRRKLLLFPADITQKLTSSINITLDNEQLTTPGSWLLTADCSQLMRISTTKQNSCFSPIGYIDQSSLHFKNAEKSLNSWSGPTHRHRWNGDNASHEHTSSQMYIVKTYRCTNIRVNIMNIYRTTRTCICTWSVKYIHACIFGGYCVVVFVFWNLHVYARRPCISFAFAPTLVQFRCGEYGSILYFLFPVWRCDYLD